MARRKDVTDEQIQDALNAAGGRLRAAARALGVSCELIRYRTNPAYREKQKQQQRDSRFHRWLAEYEASEPEMP